MYVYIYIHVPSMFGIEWGSIGSMGLKKGFFMGFH
jgi:hypothetical protein